jgi:hypothetical protein
MPDTRSNAAAWTPTLATTGAILVAFASAWSGCNDVRADVQALRRAVDLQTIAIDRMGARVELINTRTAQAQLDAELALRRTGALDAM